MTAAGFRQFSGKFPTPAILITTSRNHLVESVYSLLVMRHPESRHGETDRLRARFDAAAVH